VPPPPRYAVAADVVVIAAFPHGARVLLVRRANPPAGWALPGGFVEPDEDLPEAARRELAEETSVAVDEIVQIGAYGRPHRDPRGRTVSVVYGAVLKRPPTARAADDAAAVRWFPVDALPDDLAFDHAEILQDALPRLAAPTDRA
jgi:8-oxo-dGTP diphosphatase